MRPLAAQSRQLKALRSFANLLKRTPSEPEPISAVIPE